MAKERFDHGVIDATSQEKWANAGTFVTDLTATDKPPYYLLFEFPYPSGDLHIGHWYAFALTDIYARFKRMQGHNVLFPMGFDAFGLPAENAAMKYGKDPKVWTYENMETMRKQVERMGTSVDWSKEVITCDPSYYKWTQWLFTKFFEQGLAERKEAPVKWCPKDATVLANEQVVDGRCERCGSEVEEKKLTQWFMKITDYAERLLQDLDTLSWPEEIKEAQRAWIGKSEGAKLHFPLSFTKNTKEDPAPITVFTTRPDTIYGATYIVLAPEHSWVKAILDTDDVVVHNQEEVRAYVEGAKKKTERERSENKEKTGVKVEGVVAINPATKEEIPVYVADYVLGSYGTGAVMAVPAHDERDFAFATKHHLPMRQVVVPCAVDAGNPPQEGFEEVKRDTVIVHLRDTKTGKYALLNWHGTLEGITTAIMGGIEEGQTPEEAALAEIREEAGLEGVRIVKQAAWITAAKYCASHKKQNRCAHAYGFLAEVDGLDSQKETDAYEKDTHTLVWVDEKEVHAKLIPAHQKLVWRLLNQEMALGDDGYLINSGTFDGRDNTEVIEAITKSVGGEMTINYRIRDWLISRQRYWGCPIPIVYDPEGRAHPIPEEHLPWELPSDVDFSQNEGSPLATSKELKERVTRIFGEGWTPEYDTLDTFVDSSWYFLRYLDPKDDHYFSDAELIKKWMPVDRYSGGSEHTTMHLLYARFFTKALYDLALVPVEEPFTERFNRGLILGPDGAKMSKSKGNVINPDECVGKYGADAVRSYLAFIGPYNEAGHYPWNLDGVEGMRRFLDRVYRLYDKVNPNVQNNVDQENALRKAIEKCNSDIERFKFNTALSSLMVLIKEFENHSSLSPFLYIEFLKLLAPFAPHLTEHLWALLGNEGSIHLQNWPVTNGLANPENADVIGVQVNGKKKGEITIRKGATEEEVLQVALGLPALSKLTPERVIYIAGRVINIVPKTP